MRKINYFKNFQWQLYWKSWSLSYDKQWDKDFLIYCNYLIIGPLQIRWFSL